MIESLKSASALRNNSAADSRENLAQQPVDPQGEAAGLSAAIQRLIAERNTYRNQANTQEREMIRLRAINEELRRQNEHVTLVRDHYIRLSTELLTHLKQFDLTLKEVVKKTYGAAAEMEDRDAALISLARRLSPNQRPDQAPADDRVMTLR
jgi:hypothetical protein